MDISGAEYEKQYFPLGAYLFVAKDMEPTKVGSIHLPGKVRDEHSKFTSTGIVVAKSLFEIFETEFEKYFFGIIKKGDRVGFSSTVPLYSPSPPDFQFEGDDKEKYVTLHATDVVSILCDTEEKRVEFAERFGR